MTTKSQIYFKTLSHALTGVQDAAALANAVLAEPWEGRYWEPISYGQTQQLNFEIVTLKGKQTRKFFHASIYRMDSGTYELTTYIL